MNLFHRHKFDPEKWELVSSINVVKTIILMGSIVHGDPVPMGVERVYRNFCTSCGDLVFRRVKDIEQ